MSHPLLALHGFTEIGDCWRTALDGLPAAAPTLPGHGGKPCPAGTTAASCAASIAGGLSAPHDVVGYSLGGRIALQLAVDHPAKIRRLVLVSTTAGIEDAAARAARCTADCRLADFLEQDGIGPFTSWWEQHPTLRPSRPLANGAMQRLRAVRLGQDPRGLAAALRCLGTGAMESLWPRLGALRLPTLVVCGAADAKFLPIAKRLAAAIPGARLEAVADSGHAVHREQPAALRSLLASFLA